ncbi:hypothetical protein [Desulfofalx alkaliphila]|uniref:hypothetical protein n=1 Tax=Desulfofalx alkaliphila TaxID=105483 RepID=UPI0004E28012|nr:hypothetical protein [Desulfofalx alkaliphila]
MYTITPQSGNIGIIKAPHAVKTTGVTLVSPDFEKPYKALDKHHLISAAMTGKFDYRWEYSKEDEAYLLKVNYFQGKLEFTVRFPKKGAGEILQALISKNQRVVTMVLKYKEGARLLFDDAVVLMGIELEVLPEAGWPQAAE